MTYSIDSSALIRLWRHMPPDIISSLWDRLEEMGSNGHLLVSEEVKVELNRGADGLYDWVHKRPELIVPSTEIQDAATEIIANHNIVDPEETANQADPWVIAVAENRDATVVSCERKRKPGSPRQKIPDVCEARDVRHLMHLDFLRDAGVKI